MIFSATSMGFFKLTLQVGTGKESFIQTLHTFLSFFLNTQRFAPACSFAILCHTAKLVFQTELFSPLNIQNA